MALATADTKRAPRRPNMRQGSSYAAPTWAPEGPRWPQDGLRWMASDKTGLRYIARVKLASDGSEWEMRCFKKQMVLLSKLDVFARF